MSFRKYDEKGKDIRKRVQLDCSCDEPLTEQSHKEKQNINNIIKKHGMDLIQKTSLLASSEYTFDDVTGNDFQEAMFKINKAQDTFSKIPSEIRKRFNNNPAEFLDFVQNSDNMDEMVELGLAQRETPQQPVQVTVTNGEALVTTESSLEPQTNQETPAG